MQSAKPFPKFATDPKRFFDDDPLPEKFSQFNPDALNNYLSSLPFTLTLKPMQSTFQPPGELPVLASIITKDPFLSDQGVSLKPSIDIICVVDHSGSMQGINMRLLKGTLELLLEFLSDDDRLSLVIFDDKPKRLLPLLRMNDDNKKLALVAINSIKPEGGTNICGGLEYALEVLKQRRHKNQVASILLLSDGLEEDALPTIKDMIKKFDIKENFSINTFGYGLDHDPVLMSEIANLKGGRFYMLERPDQVDECFADCLGGLISIIGLNGKIEVQVNQENKGVFISKVFGKCEVKPDGQSVSFTIPQLVAGSRRDFVFVISLPKQEKFLQDHEKNKEIARGRFTVDKLLNKKEEKPQEEKMFLNTEFSLTLLNPFENLIDMEKDEDVEVNYLRVLAAENMEIAQKEAEKNNFEKGQNLITEALTQIVKSKRSKHVNVVPLIQGLNEAQKMCQPKVYENVGRHYMISENQAHMNQQSRPNYTEKLYSNRVQQELVSTSQKVKAKKKY